MAQSEQGAVSAQAVQAEPGEPQLMPAGVLVTVPLPVPVVLTASATNGTGAGSNVAVIVVSPSTVTTQRSVPLHPAPVHPAKTESVPGEAVSVTVSPGTYVAPQVALQSMPAGTLVTVPLPAPAVLTVKVTTGTLEP